MSEKATFAMGCFWEPDLLFSQIPGVTKATVGYTGGTKKNPTYEEVCSGETGHAEAVEIDYDPNKITYNDLLKVFWQHHNPTTPNQQGPDIGEQYRSAIFYHDENQKKLAEKSKTDLEASSKWPNPIVTEIVPANEFYEAEDYHQDYLKKRGITTCRI